MKDESKSFTSFLKKRAPIYLGLIGLFFLFAYPALMEKNLESHIPTDLTEEERAMVDFLLSYNGLNNSGMTIMNVIEEEIATKYPDEKIYDEETTDIKITFDMPNDSEFSQEITFLIIIDKENLSYTWNVDSNTGEISAINQESKRILDIVNYYN
jgi:hypothetical protein